MSGLSSIAKILDISTSDKSRLPIKLDKSNSSVSNLATKPDKSIFSKSIPDNFNMDVISDMLKSEFINPSIRSDMLIADKSQSDMSKPKSAKSIPKEPINSLKSSSIALKLE